MQYDFQWDPVKAHSNVVKHGVTFEEATKVFDDPLALTIFDDEESSGDEERWITLGLIEGRHFLVVVHTYHSSVIHDTITIRLISARPATKHEIRQYKEG